MTFFHLQRIRMRLFGRHLGILSQKMKKNFGNMKLYV